MSTWPRHPMVYEINTWVWLFELSDRAGPSVNLGTVPSIAWDRLAKFGFDAIWFMGVWQRSPASIAIANRNHSLLDEFKRAVPDFQPQDNIGSAYSVRHYVVDQRLGGPEALTFARGELAKRGMRLILDFVPNHVALDHNWVTQHPEYFIHGDADDALNDPQSFVEVNGKLFAYGRDPYFPAWQDVLQLNAFHPGLRQAALETVLSIAGQCDGVRCDMAMLLLNSIFRRTWGSRSGPQPTTEYWADLIAAVKKIYPDFLFIAEAYWDREWELQQQGFDFCYDKRLYDRLARGTAAEVRSHLHADIGYQTKLLRFIENHDEQRAAAAFPFNKHRDAAVAMATLPSAKLFHEGELEGKKKKLPVFLRRRATEPVNQPIEDFYTKLLQIINASSFRVGNWALCHCTGWLDNPSYQNLTAWNWIKETDCYLIIVNFSDSPAQGRVQVLWGELRGRTCRLLDLFSGETYERDGAEMLDPGLYVNLIPWGFHFFRSEIL